jgi:hypothetical protein
MKISLLNASLAVVLAGSASLAAAQATSTAQSPEAARFNSQFSEMQAMVSSSGAWKPQQHVVVTPPQTAPALTEGYMQSMSKENSTVWQPQAQNRTSVNQLPADPVGPGGLNLSQYQQYSSESPVWQRMETQPYTGVASANPGDSFEARVVALFHGNSASKTSSED